MKRVNKLFPIVLALLFFSCDEDSKPATEIKSVPESLEMTKWEEGWSKSRIMDYMQQCPQGDCDNEFLTCDEQKLMCKCDVEAIAHSFSYSRWQKLSSSKDESILTASDLKALEKKVLYQKECYYDNNLISDFILDVLASIEQALEGLKKDYNE